MLFGYQKPITACERFFSMAGARSASDAGDCDGAWTSSAEASTARTRRMSVGSGDHPVGDVEQPPAVESRFGERAFRALDPFSGKLARTVEAVERRVGQLACRRVLPGCLAKRGRLAFDVQ